MAQMRTGDEAGPAERVRSGFADSAYGTADPRGRSQRSGAGGDRGETVAGHGHRPNVERTVAQVATRGGRRLKLRYRGTLKNNAWLRCRTAALNLRNLIGRGLDHVNGTWIVVTT
jgi:hypothetical protein